MNCKMTFQKESSDFFFHLYQKLFMFFVCSVAKLCPTLRPQGLQHTGLPFLRYHLEFAQINVH